MVKSNINIASNIYIRRDPNIKRDKQYVEKITGAKRIRDIKSRYCGFEAIHMLPVQEEIASGNTVCSYAKNGEMSFGAVMTDGVMKWENRCENTQCSRYNECVSKRVQKVFSREPVIVDYMEERESLQKFFKALGISIQEDTVFFEKDKSPAKTEENPKEYVLPAEQAVEDVKEAGRKYSEIKNPDCIISSPLDSHIILNSGPGTGKTYTIIQRLIYILANDLCPADEIYILCYTRSAKEVVESKIEQAVVRGIIQPAAKNICVLTFDSYAAYFLTAMREQGVIKENFDNYDYNKRIKLFNQYISPDDLEVISYFIVDEIQDLVNERAEMVLNILRHLKCGYLLAGDRCQSIYDYEADDDATLDSVKFYELAEKQFPNDMLRYEITENRRQAAELAEEAESMRRVLLNGSFIEQNKYANKVISNYSGKTKVESYIKTLTQSPAASTAILCRNNGEAEYISSLLCEKGIPHKLNRGVNNAAPLPRWIADVFWDHCSETISRKDFMERFNFRCETHLESENVWQILCKMADSQDTSMISIAKLISALTVSNNIPCNFFDEAPSLTV